jgi:NAD(P)-dependent dehydrogenase (short-subunit alcohol dehydrogenase family)
MELSPLNFSQPGSAIVFGATGGIGAAAIEILARDHGITHIYAGARAHTAASDKITPFQFDLTDESSIADAAHLVAENGVAPRLIFIATGQLHDGDQSQPEKSWRQQSPENYAHMFALNAAGPAMIGKHFLPLLPRSEKAIFAAISAKVGSISDNRLGGWHAYRASKAALNMIVRNFALELTVRNPDALAVTLHPGTVDTLLSKPFQRGVPDGKLFTPQRSAAALLSVLGGLTSKDSGKLFGWDGQEIPY